MFLTKSRTATEGKHALNAQGGAAVEGNHVADLLRTGVEKVGLVHPLDSCIHFKISTTARREVKLLVSGKLTSSARQGTIWVTLKLGL
jgi:hypothetical protein